MSALLTALQEGAAEVLKDHVFFTPADFFGTAIPVITEKLKDIENEIQRKLATLGVAVIIVTPGATVGNPEVPGPELSEIFLVARVVESPLLNTTGQPAAYVAECVARILHCWDPSIAGQVVNPLLCDSIRLGNDPRNLSYDVTFRTSAHLAPAEEIARI